MIIDGHAHISNSEYGDVKALLEQYKDAKIDQGVLVPGGMLDVRKMTRYITGEEKPVTMDVPNHLVEEAMKQHPGKFFGFYCVDPHQGERGVEEFANAVGRGFSGLKLAPIVHSFSYTSNTVLELVKLSGDLGIPVYLQSQFTAAASTKKIGYLAKTFPKTNFIIAHMGFGPADVDAIQYAKENDNLFLETSQGSNLIIQQAMDELGSTKLIFGSEFPLYHPLSEVTKIHVLKCSGNDRDNIFCKNILNLVKKA